MRYITIEHLTKTQTNNQPLEECLEIINVQSFFGITCA